ILSSLRPPRGTVPAAQARDEVNAGVLFSLCVTGALTAAVLYLFRHETHSLRGGSLLALSLASAAVGIVLRRLKPAPAQALGLAHRVAGAALLVLAVPAAFSGVPVEIGWAVLAVTFGVVARRLDSRVSRTAAIVTWSLAC